MSQVVSTVESKCSKELAKLCEEGNIHGVGERMREVWPMISGQCIQISRKIKTVTVSL